MVEGDWRGWRVKNLRPMISVPRELLTAYHRIIGSEAVLVWLHLQGWEAESEVLDLEALVRKLEMQTGFPPDIITLAIHTLQQYELVEVEERVIRLCLPVSEEQFARRFGAEKVADLPRTSAQASESAVGMDHTLDTAVGAAGNGLLSVGDRDDQAPTTLNRDAFTSPEADLHAVLDLYHKRIGLMGPKQRDILRYWVEESSMSAEVVAAAIDVTARQAENPRIPYLVGVLRNWYNDGVRTYADAVKKYPEIAGNKAVTKSYEGLPNAGAYTDSDSDRVRKWKELYPDEYNS